MPWYSFRQNNSGGSFFIDETVDVYVIVEEATIKKAIKKARSITKNHRAYCECCGDRWNFSEDRIEVCIERPTNLDSSAILYSLDGSRAKISGPPKKPSSWDRQGSAFTDKSDGSEIILRLLLQHSEANRLKWRPLLDPSLAKQLRRLS